MTDFSTPVIPKELKSQAEDYRYLFERGIGFLRQLSGKVWTDYNAHDPGITILEILCYNLTELSLKAHLDISDIIASGLHAAKDGLIPAKEILPSNPTIPDDYRKLLTDLDGVKNAWILPIPPNEAHGINGLYDILLELDAQPDLGDLNKSIIFSQISVNLGPRGIRDYEVEFSFPFWDEDIVQAFSTDVTINAVTGPGSAPIILLPTDPFDESDYYANLEVLYNGSFTFSFGITVKHIPGKDQDPAVKSAVETEIITVISQVGDGSPSDNSIIKEYNRKVSAASEIRDEVLEVFYKNRNLDEDIHTVKAVRIQEIAVHADIKILQNLNVEKYLANLYLDLNRFFDPDMTLNSIDELGELPIELIFEGPLLNNGFITDGTLYGQGGGVEFQNTNVVFVSDIGHIVIEAAGKGVSLNNVVPENKIIATEIITLSNYIRNRIVQSNAKNCLALAKPEIYKPRFSSRKSRIRFFRNDTEVNYNTDLVNTIFNELQDSELPGNLNTTLKYAEGEQLDIAEYSSVQYDFPPLYGLANNVLSERSTTVEQRAKVEQLRAYITVFDQTLVSYTNQLYHINQLFSIDENESSTYFKSTLYDLPQLDKILADFLNGSSSWETFIADLDNSYQQLLTEIMEAPTVFADRRNRFLDHVMARFGMQLKEFTTFRYAEQAQNVDSEQELDLRNQEIALELIRDKCLILQDYPVLSRDRFLAYNYAIPAWHTQNISGLANRLLSLLAIKNKTRRTLYDEATGFIQVTPLGGVFNFMIRDSDSIPMLVSNSSYPGAPAAFAAALESIRQGVVRDSYHFDEQIVGSDTVYQVSIEHEEPALPSYLASTPLQQDDQDKARLETRRIIRELKEIGSGVHVVEHVLLRPNTDLPVTESLAINEGDPPESLTDPYSFHVTVVFPSGFRKNFNTDGELIPYFPAHFNDESFRKYAESLVHDEVPSHIVPHIFWLDTNSVADAPDTPSLRNFESKWEAWLTAKSNPAIGPVVLNNLRGELILVMNAMFIMN